MSLTLLLWICLFIGLSVLAFQRPAWGTACYMLTVYLCPPFWWWGKELAGYRWNFYSGWLLLAVVMLHRRNTPADPPGIRKLQWLALAVLGNATLVHVALAPHWEISSGPYIDMCKFVVLFLLIIASVRTETDLRILMWSIILGAAYIGYEVTINDRGNFRAGRLEGVGMPNASAANELASLMVTVMPLTVPMLLTGRRWERLLILPLAPLIVNVVLECNSRGAFLSCIATAIIFVLASPPGARKKCLIGVALGGVATWMMMGDERIMARFMSTFVSNEQRDSSAVSRLQYWEAGVRMIADHPLGAGGDGFHNVYGPSYIAAVAHVQFEGRSVHNGFINTACDWGIQGFLLTMAVVLTSLKMLWRTMRAAARAGRTREALIGIAIFAGTLGFLITSIFGDFLDNEWFYWIVACAAVYVRVAHLPATEAFPHPLGVRQPLSSPGIRVGTAGPPLGWTFAIDPRRSSN